MMNNSKNILIVGTSRGIGAALVKECMQRGHKVYALSRHRGAFADSDWVRYFPFDLEGNILEQIESIQDHLPKIDIVINNAGYLVNAPFQKLTTIDWQKSFQTNALGPILLVQALLPLLSEQRSHIVNISTMGAVQGSAKFAGLSAYSTSKSAICTFTELFSEEFKDTTITMNCLCLGAVQTEMLEAAFPGFEAPLKSEEMAQFITDFALKSDRFIRGKILPISLSTP